MRCRRCCAAQVWTLAHSTPRTNSMWQTVRSSSGFTVRSWCAPRSARSPRSRCTTSSIGFVNSFGARENKMREAAASKAETNGHATLCPRCQRAERAAQMGIDPAGPLTSEQFGLLGGYSWSTSASQVSDKIRKRYAEPIAEAEELVDRALE